MEAAANMIMRAAGRRARRSTDRQTDAVYVADCKQAAKPQRSNRGEKTTTLELERIKAALECERDQI